MNNNDNKCFQCVATLELNHQKIAKDSVKITKINNCLHFKT